MKKWKCSVCNYIHDGDKPPEKCPKCGSPAEKFMELEAEAAEKIEQSRETNMIHMTVCEMLEDLEVLAENGAEINLDPGCLKFFNKLKEAAKSLKQDALAELETHVKKGKWG